MKSILATLIVSFCLIGIGAAEKRPHQRDKDSAPASRDAKADKPKSKANHKTHEATGKQGPRAKKNPREKAARKSTGDRRSKAIPAKKAQDAKKASETAARKKALEAKKAAEATAKKQAEYEKRGKALEAATKDLGNKRKLAYGQRLKAAEALKSTDQKLAEIDLEIKKIQQEQALRTAAARRKAEAAKAQRLRTAITKEKADMAKMRSDIDTMKRDISQLLQQLEALSKQTAPKSGKK